MLWNNLVNVASLHSSPRIIAGDFNEVLADDEKYGGRVVNANWSLLFKDCLDMCNMVDLGSQDQDSPSLISRALGTSSKKDWTDSL